MEQYLFERRLAIPSCLSLEISKVLKDYMLKYKKDGRSIHEIYSCDEGYSDSFPPLSIIPATIRANPERFDGCIILKGKSRVYGWV